MLFARVVDKDASRSCLRAGTDQARGVVGRARLAACRLWVALVGLVVFVELSRRRLPVEFAALHPRPAAVSGAVILFVDQDDSSGVIPSVVAPWFYLLPLSIAGFAFRLDLAMAGRRVPQMAWGHIGHMILGSVAIVILAFIYTAVCRRSRACRGFPEKAWRCDPANRAGRADRRACRSRRVLHDLRWRGLSGLGFPDT